MVFRIFRQNQKATKWIYLVVTVFTMLTFSVTGAIYDWMQGSKAERTSAGSFVLPSGKKVTIGAEQFRLISQQLSRFDSLFPEQRFKESERIWEFLIADALAADSGLIATREDLQAGIQQLLTGVPADQLEATYVNGVLRRCGMNATEFEALFSRLLRVGMYQALTQTPPRMRSDAILKQLQDEAELLTVEYVTFANDGFAAKIDPATVTDDQLKAFADGLDLLERTREFSTPAEYKIDAGYLDVATADAAKLRASLNANELGTFDAEVARTYEQRKETKYKLPAPPADPNAPAAEGEKKEEEPKYKTLDEVKPEIERELLVQRVISKVQGEFNKRIAEQATAKAQAEKDGKPAPEAVNILEQVSMEFGLEYIPAPETAVKFADLATLPRIGSDTLKQNFEFVSKDAALPFMPSEERAFGFVARVVDKVEPQIRPIAEIREKLLPKYVEAESSKLALEAAKAFLAALDTAARPKVQAEIDTIESEAKTRATEAATAQNVTDEAAKQKLVEDEIKKVQWRVDGLLKEHRHEVFDEVVKAQALTVNVLGPYRKDYSRTAFYQSEPKGAAKFLMGQGNIAMLTAGKLADPMTDKDSKATYVVRMKERRAPEWTELRGGDFATAKMMYQFRMQYSGMGAQRPTADYNSLALLVNLERSDNAKTEESGEAP